GQARLAMSRHTEAARVPLAGRGGPVVTNDDDFKQPSSFSRRVGARGILRFPLKRMRGMERREALFCFLHARCVGALCEARSPLSAPSRRLKLRAALLLGPVGFRRSALSQPAPGR